MRLLLDTHVFLGWVQDAREISRRARAAIANPENECRLSLVSCWEMAIKSSLEKLQLPAPLETFVPEQLAANRFTPLGIEFRHITRVARLRFHHRDPFDRLLAAQALEEDIAVVSRDPIFRSYGVKRIW
jgi:PIN domain nuclease of toxin-antitoxin system